MLLRVLLAQVELFDLRARGEGVGEEGGGNAIAAVSVRTPNTRTERGDLAHSARARAPCLRLLSHLADGGGVGLRRFGAKSLGGDETDSRLETVAPRAK